MSCIGQSAASHSMATPTMKNRFWLTVVTGSPAGTTSGPMFRTE